MRLFPAILSEWRSHFTGTVVLVAGTNGKTTTTNYIACSLEALGARVVANRRGANLPSGVVTSVLDDAVSRDPATHYAVFECDERALEMVASATRPGIIVILNVFRDQLDRYGDLRDVIDSIASGLEASPPGTIVIANADDPNVVFACSGANRKVIWLSLNQQMIEDLDRVLCPNCTSELTWTQSSWSCRNCHFSKPLCDFTGEDLWFVSFSSLHMSIDGIDLWLPQWGRCNAFNAVATWAALRSLGFSPSKIATALSCSNNVYGRNERIAIGSGVLTIQLIKNPASFNEFVTHLKMQNTKPTIVVAVNNNTADGKDTSWIWDADFEGLSDAPSVIASGARAPIVVNRLKYAAIAQRTGPMSLPASLSFAVDRARAGQNVVYLCTYTAMLQARALLKKKRIIAA